MKAFVFSTTEQFRAEKETLIARVVPKAKQQNKSIRTTSGDANQ